jgi:hypothetical protein
MDKDDDDKTQPAKAPEHGAVRKHDAVSVTDEERQEAPKANKYFNDDGNKVEDVEFVGGRSPDTDPDDRDDGKDPKPA